MTAHHAQAGRFLCYVLRHRPDAIGLTLDDRGYVAIADLITALARHGHPVSRMQLVEIVATDAKRRFGLCADGTRIRAQQGHSIEVDLGYAPATPPAILFHGTVRASLPSIRQHGLTRMQRHHVHLSAGETTAKLVGSRRGDAVILRVDSRAMHDAGHSFFLTPNGVWLTESVPAAFLSGWPTS